MDSATPSPGANQTRGTMKPFIMSISSTVTLLLSGCGGGVDVVATTEGTTAHPETVRASDDIGSTPQEFVSVSGTVHAADGSPLSGVQACLQAGPTISMDIGDCATSVADGSWTVSGVPA